MVKCVVSSCLNREQLNADLGFNRAPKRFFSFPKDPARIKVWLAALREPDKQDLAEKHVICEDHFLPEDISASGVSPDAIPIMPPCLEEELGLDVWPEDPDEEDSWAMADESEYMKGEHQYEAEVEYGEKVNEEAEIEVNDEVNVEANEEANDKANKEADEDANEANANDAVDIDKDEEQEKIPQTDATPLVTEGSTDAVDKATVLLADGNTEPATITQRCSPSPAPSPSRSPSPSEPKSYHRKDVSLHQLTQRFLELLLNRDGSLDVRDAAKTLQTQKRRMYDVTSILMGIDLLGKESVNRVRWTGKCPISSFLWEKQKMQQESEKLKKVEDTLDGLIKSCAQQLFSMTDDRSNANDAFVTFADVQNLPVFQDQTVIVVKAPEETKLEVPSPKEGSIQVHLKSGSSPISVLTCEVWPDHTGKIPQAFLQIQHSHIRTRPLKTESSSQSTVLSL